MRIDREDPQHRVSIPWFAVGRYEVRYSEWVACESSGGCGGHRPTERELNWGPGRASRPVVDVSWHHAKAYAEWLSEKTGEDYRLLTEAEWEYAARAGTTTRYFVGDFIQQDQANFGTGAGYKAVAVGSYSANAFGLYDMNGNVWEWVEDCRNESYVGAPTDGSAWTDGDCGERVMRSGAWGSQNWSVSSTVRFPFSSGYRHATIGFRIARGIR
jgi:formylglycine-generating enzyme required for sulfatase activity